MFLNFPTSNLCGCDGVEEVFDVKGVMRKEFVEVNRGVKMTEASQSGERDGSWVFFMYIHFSQQVVLDVHTFKNR